MEQASTALQLRARGHVARPGRGAAPAAGAASRAGRQRRHGRDRLPDRVGHGLRQRAVLPQRHQPGHARFLPAPAAGCRAGRRAGAVHRAVLPRPAGAARADPGRGAGRRARSSPSCWRSSPGMRWRLKIQRARRARAVPADGRAQCAGLADRAAGQPADAGRALRRPAEGARTDRAAAADRVLRHQPHHGRSDRGLVRGVRAGRAGEVALPPLQHRRHHARATITPPCTRRSPAASARWPRARARARTCC